MSLTLKTHTIQDVLVQRPCVNPLRDSRFAELALTLDTEFNILDVEIAVKKGLVNDLDLDWLTLVLNWFEEPNGPDIIFQEMGERRNLKPWEYCGSESIGDFDNTKANDVDADRKEVNELFFRVIHDLTGGKPIFNWEAINE